MRWRAEEATRWPTDQGWDAWWRHELGDPAQRAELVEGVADLDGLPLRLTQGEHLRPGAGYEMVAPELTIGAARVDVGGTDGARSVRAEYREFGWRRRGVVMDLEGLDVFDSVTVRSNLRHLGCGARLRRQRDGLLDAELELDWLTVRVQADVLRRATGESLVVRLRIVGAGVWRPVLAPLLAMAAPLIRRGLLDLVAGAAERLQHLDEDPAGTGSTSRELRQRALGAEIFRRRFHEVVDTVDARPWFRRGSGALLTAYQELPAVSPHWPRGAGNLVFGTWWDEEDWLFQGFLAQRVRRRHRHAEVDRQVGAWLARQQVLLEAGAKARAEAEARDDIPLLLTDEVMDLSWLSSPWSTVRQMIERERAAPGSERDIPAVQTDEEAQRFVTQMLREGLTNQGHRR